MFLFKEMPIPKHSKIVRLISFELTFATLLLFINNDDDFLFLFRKETVNLKGFYLIDLFKMKYYIQEMFIDFIEIDSNPGPHTEILLEMHGITFDKLNSHKVLCLMKILIYILFIVIWEYP